MSRSATPLRGRAEDELRPLAQAALDGEPRAVRELLTAVAPLALSVIRKVLGAQHPDVEDVLQETLLGTLDALTRFRGESSVSHFVHRIALLTILNARRRHQLRQSLAPHVALDGEAGNVPFHATPSDELDVRRRRELFVSLLDELPAQQAEVLALLCLLGYTVDETAALFGVPANTVRSRLLSAKAALRKRLADDIELSEVLRGAS